jgi:hypothetical protein
MFGFNEKEPSPESSLKGTSTPKSGTSTPKSTSRFRFGRNKSTPAIDVDDLPPPPSVPWTPEGTTPQRSNVTSAYTSRRNSLTSVRSSMLTELKYEAMVNHLFQQQCSRWPMLDELSMVTYATQDDFGSANRAAILRVYSCGKLEAFTRPVPQLLQSPHSHITARISTSRYVTYYQRR